jgi:putative heme iron utilization protein
MANDPTKTGRHGRGEGSDDERPELLAARAPTHAERCRTLVSGARSATLCTIAREPAGYPYGSLVTVAWDREGRALMLLSRLAEHTQNLDDRAEASMLVTEPPGRHEEVLALGRVTLLGRCEKVPAAEVAEVRAAYLAAQPRAAYYVDFDDFAFYRLAPTALRYVGGFGRMSWVGAEEYARAEPDPLAGAAADILAHMNDDHGDALLAYAKGLLGVSEASAVTMTAVDRYGFDMAIATPKGPKAARLAFDAPLATTDEVRVAMVALVKRARAALG